MKPPLPTQYQHPALLGKKWIRLLRLLPQQDDSLDIAVCLTAHDLDDNIVPYTSLSYSRGRNSDGDASLCREILIDGHVLAVTENLHDFLLRMHARRDEDHVLLWIDAICINQADIQERNAQVAMMAEIYQRASKMIIWLGNGAYSRSESAVIESGARLEELFYTLNCPCKRRLARNITLEYLNPKQFGVSMSFTRRAAFRMGCVVHRVSLRSTSSFVPRTEKHRLAQHLVRYALRLAVLDPSYLKEPMDDLRVVADLCTRRYFSRRWVVQEIFHSNKQHTSVYWGSSFLNASQFESIVKSASSMVLMLEASSLYLPEGTRETTHAARSAYFNVMRLSRKHRVGMRGNMLETLRDAGKTSCTDDRDRLFALLSVGEQNVMLPDYSLSVVETYIAFAKRMVQLGHIADVLVASAAQWALALDGRPNPGLPSWVPDIRLPLTHVNFEIMQQHVHHRFGPESCLTFTANICRASRAAIVAACGHSARDGDYVCRTRVAPKGEGEGDVVLRPTNAGEVRPASFSIVGDFRGGNDIKPDCFWEQEITIV